MYIFIFCFVLLLCYFILEKRINDACLASFTAVIHVNGIRGKTSTCRYLDAVLRTRYKVFTKTTGTDAMILDVSGRELPCRRLGPANIHEQLRMIRRAKREGAEILILECMAVRPELQKIAQGQIVKSRITVITNVRYDHVFEMGDSLEEIAASLSFTVPEDGVLYTADPQAAAFLEKTAQERRCRIVACPGTGTAEENIGIARAVSRDLGVTDAEFAAALPNVVTDFGARKLYPLRADNGNAFFFLNLFSANDPVSTRCNVEDARLPGAPLCFLYNHREDRPDRALLFARHFFPEYPDCPVYIAGNGASLPKRLFAHCGASDLRFPKKGKRGLALLKSLPLPEGAMLVGVGNIKGNGYAIVEELEKTEAAL